MQHGRADVLQSGCGESCSLDVTYIICSCYASGKIAVPSARNLRARAKPMPLVEPVMSTV